MSQDTEKAIEVLNYFLFEYEYYSDIRDQAAGYGVTHETPVTIDWLIVNNRDAISVMNLVSANHFLDRSYILSTYDKIIAEREEEQ